MSPRSFRFDRFLLDEGERQLLCDGAPVELNARYFDAMTLMVREAGKLVSKDRFMDEVWRGVPVTDEALTQCIRTLRRLLGDEAASPRFIETVPKHGYRFIAAVQPGELKPERAVADVERSSAAVRAPSWRQFFLIGGAGTLGAGLAGIIGGLFYGLVAAAQPPQAGMGAISILLVLLCLTIAPALMGGAGVSFGIAAARFAPAHRRLWTVLGGAFGGMIVGALVKLLGLDAFNLLLGQAPTSITGAGEGALLGGAVGLGILLGRGGGSYSLRRGILAAAATGGAAGLLIPLLGGRLMGGSLDLLARSFRDSRLRLDAMGALFGEDGFGPVSQLVTAGLEGALFGCCIGGAMVLARRSLRPSGQAPNR